MSARARMLLPAVIASCAFSGLACGAGRSTAVPPPVDVGQERLFAPDSVFNLALRPDAPIDADSARYVVWFDALITRYGASVNLSQCTQPLYWAGARTRHVRVRLEPSVYQDRALLAAWRSVPLPKAAQVADCPDRNLAVAQRQRDGSIALWEFWKLRRASGRWFARWGGATRDARKDRGVASEESWPGQSVATSRFWNVSASSVAMSAGVVTVDELRRGKIDHALSMATTTAAAGRWRWPAQRGDGGSHDRWALPEGSHLRIDPAVDLSKLALTPLARMLAEAAQRYGIVIRDQTAAQSVFVSDRRPGEPLDVPGLLAGKPGYQALDGFPWQDLQLLAAPTCVTLARSCSVASKVRVATDVREAPDGAVAVTADTSNSSLDLPRRTTRWRVAVEGHRVREATCTTCVHHVFEVPRGKRFAVRATVTTNAGAHFTGRAASRAPGL